MDHGKLLEEELTGSVIGAFFEVYRTLGFGFLENLYVSALERELRAVGHQVAREVGVRVSYKGEGLRQLLNYLKASNLEIGLLLHFGPLPKFYRLIHSNRPNYPSQSAESVPYLIKRSPPFTPEAAPQ